VHNVPCIPLNTEHLIVIAQLLSFGICQDVIPDVCSMVETKDPLSKGEALEV